MNILNFITFVIWELRLYALESNDNLFVSLCSILHASGSVTLKKK